MSQKRVFNTNAEHIYVNDVPEYNLDLVNARSIDPAYSFTRNSSATYVGPDGYIKTAGVNQPRFDYDPVTGDYKGLLVEESRANYARQSNRFDVSPWTTYTRLISGSFESQNDTYFRIRQITNTSINFFGINNFSPSFNGFSAISRNTTITYSFDYNESLSLNYSGGWQFWYRPADTLGTFTSLSYNITDHRTWAKKIILSDGWVRYYHSFVLPFNLSSYRGFYGGFGSLDNTTGGYYAIRRFQLEIGNTPTSYIPTSGSTVTRQPDQLVLNKTLNTQGTFFIESNPTTGVSLVADNGSSSLSITQPNNQYTKSVLYYNTNRTLRMSSDNSVPSDYIYTNPQDLNRVSLGFNKLNNSSYINGYLKKFSYYSSPLSEDNLRALTDNKVSIFRTSGSANIVTNGLVLNLDAGNPASYPGSGTTWTDLSGNGNNGTLVGGVGFNGSNGGYLSFDGVNDYVNCGNDSSLNVENNITVNVWFYVNQTASFDAIIAKVVNDYSLGWELDNSSGTFRVTLRPAATQINLIAGSLSVGNWYMGTMTFDNTTARLYLNGVQTGSTTSGGPVTLNSTEPLRIGGRVQGPNFEGNIASTQIYNRALTASEIQQNFNVLRGRFGI